jgi:hypothetical protein
MRFGVEIDTESHVQPVDYGFHGAALIEKLDAR